MVMRPKCHNLCHHHYFVKISLVGWMTADAPRNRGLRYTLGSRVVMIRRIHTNLFFQNRYLLNEVNVKIKLVRSRNSFCLMSANANPFQAR